MLVRTIVALRDAALADSLADVLDRLGVWSVRTDDVVVPEGAFDLLLVDDVDRAEALAGGLASHPDVPGLVVITPSLDPSVQAKLVADGCYAVVDSSLDPSLVEDAIAGVCERRRMENLARLDQGGVDPEDARAFVSNDPRMREVLDTAARLSRTETPVLILGETGVGKERVASLIHREGSRAEGPFIAINCAAIPAELFESELFGHARGAFTGAERDRRGYFELANGGTLFLDEVAELPMPAQAKLLRVLQEREIRPVGSDHPIPVDVRILAATNRDPRVEIDAGRFRSDLYYRLGVVEIEIPPLRQRQGDVDVLAELYRRHFAARLGRPVVSITPEAAAVLRSYAWPGNVRELVNVMERAVLLCAGHAITLRELPPALTARASVVSAERPADPNWGAQVEIPHEWLTMPWKAVREELLTAGERGYLTALLTACRGRIGETAQRAGMSERSLFEKMRRLGLRKEDFRS